jgi:hypothetical protein
MNSTRVKVIISLAQMHEVVIVYDDFHPSGIMINDQGRLVVIGFGEVAGTYTQLPEKYGIILA